jgi:hypothetical protein
MAVVHRTTMVPGKLELLADWLPRQDWYVSSGLAPELTRAGGFRLDDPAGEVGIEIMVVLDGAGAGATAYLVPMTYRGRALDGGDAALIGTTEHGVLGHRWVYDGTRDPVLIAQLAELIQGRAQAQAQSQSNTFDPNVHSSPLAADPDAKLSLEFRRVLTPADDAPPGAVSALWAAADGTQRRGVFATVRLAD